MTEKVIINGNHARGHTDITGAEVIGTITANSKTTISGIQIAKDGDIVHFPTHPHCWGPLGPDCYREHFVPVTGRSKLKTNGYNGVKEYDIVPVADEAGPNATMEATQSKVYANTI